DLRNASLREDPSCLLQDLRRRAGDRVPVIAVSDRGYVCDWAGVADLIISGHLQLPLDRKQLSGLLENQPSEGPCQGKPAPNQPRVVRSKSVAHRTYSAEMLSLLENLVTVASHDVTILLVGETGTGKTTMARMIHELSPRSESRLLTVGCGALPPELIESELFGHVKGSFTGADRSKLGKFEAAEDGSLLLDEIDVLTPAQQAKLLRVIETHEFEPVGSNDTRVSKARLIAASNLDLKHLMQRDQFRADLYYRLNMLEFHIPPLRERPLDIVPMALEFVDEFCTSHDVMIRSVHPDFLACLKSYRWPGNIRELKNHVRRAVLFCRSGELTPQDLAPHLVRSLGEAEAEAEQAESAESAEDATLFERVAQTEREMLEEALRENNQNRTTTARMLGLSRVGLYKKMKKYGMITPRK
ncbi:MAG TPA: sigma-54 dependent transcriptional regulator, partial [Thermoguttaceae bacterium]|nr:sigma-54 dependent transcriptional regulator [Thermoguttaceae bacterium]